MKIYKIGFKQFINEIYQNLFIIVTWALLLGLIVYSIGSISFQKNIKLEEIKDLDRNMIILDYEIASDSIDDILEYPNVSFIRKSFVGTSNSIDVTIVGENFLDQPFILAPRFNSQYYSTEKVELIYISDKKIDEVVNPIIIDEKAALLRYKKANVIGEKFILYIDESPKEFIVYAVIKDTSENKNLIEDVMKSNGISYEQAVVSLSRGNAYLFDTIYKNITQKEVDYSLISINMEENVKISDIEKIAQKLDVDNDKIYSYQTYYNVIIERFKESIRYNILASLVILVGFIMIFIIGLLYGFKGNKEKINIYAKIGIEPRIQLWVLFYKWVYVLISAYILTLVISLGLLTIAHGTQVFVYVIYEYILSAAYVLLILTLFLTLISLVNRHKIVNKNRKIG